LLSDRSEALLAAALDRLGRVLDRGIGRGFYKEDEKPAALAHIRATVALEDFADRDFVTEAVFEDEAVKAEIYRALDRICLPGCILASNTSTIPISTLAAYVGEARRPHFIGTHYFSPASRMKLVEVIPAFETAPETVETALRLTARPTRCRSGSRTSPASRSTACSSYSCKRQCGWSTRAWRRSRTSTRPASSGSSSDGPFELMDATTSRLVLQASDILFEPMASASGRRPC